MSLFLLQGSARDGYFCEMVRFYRMIAVFLFFSGPLGFGEGPSQWGNWETARNLYDSQKYQEALQALQEKPKETPNYYYNLGTIYYKLSQFGPSVAYLEKANRLIPHNSDIKYNLLIAKRALAQTIGPEKLDPSSTGLEELTDQISSDEMKAALGFLSLVVLLLWLRSYISSRSFQKMFMTPLGSIGLVGFILTTCVFGLQKWVSTAAPAISIQRHSVRSGPGEHYSELGKLESGTKLRLLSTSTESSADTSGNTPGNTLAKTETWQQVRYSHDGIGWVKLSNLLVL